MPHRPFISCSFDELEDIAKKSREDSATLHNLEIELLNRKKNKRIPWLLIEIRDLLSSLTGARECSQPIEQDRPDQKVHESKPGNNWDTTQRKIIELDEEESKIIEAGPGTGKTAVACARVAFLVEQCGLSASNILLISFTRTAVKEIRDRIETFAEEPRSISGLQICTLDSFTWQILRGFEEDSSVDLLSGYETNIRSFIDQLKNKNEVLLDYLVEFEHVILDEGQDLVGDRAELSIQLIAALNCRALVNDS